MRMKFSTLAWHIWQGISIFCLIMCWTFKWVTLAVCWLCISSKAHCKFNSLKPSQTVILDFAFFGFVDSMWNLVWGNNCWCAIVMKKLWNPTQAGKQLRIAHDFSTTLTHGSSCRLYLIRRHTVAFLDWDIGVSHRLHVCMYRVQHYK